MPCLEKWLARIVLRTCKRTVPGDLNKAFFIPYTIRSSSFHPEYVNAPRHCSVHEPICHDYFRGSGFVQLGIRFG